MSRSILSPAAVEVGVSSLPLKRANHSGSPTLTPGQRIIAGRAFYSAAWRDLATSTVSDPPALTCRGEAGRKRHAGDASSQQRAGGAPSSVPGLCGGR